MSREHEWPCEHAPGGAGACADSNCPAYTRPEVPTWLCRERARREITALEDAWKVIADYAEGQEMIVTNGGLGFYLGMRRGDGDMEPRAEKAINAMNWLKCEINLTKARLEILERDKVA